MVGEVVVIAVKRGVEAGDLRKAGEIRQQRSNRRQIVRLMQWCERRITLEPAHHIVVDQNRAVIVGAAMYHAVADRERDDLTLVP